MELLRRTHACVFAVALEVTSRSVTTRPVLAMATTPSPLDTARLKPRAAEFVFMMTFDDDSVGRAAFTAGRGASVPCAGAAMPYSASKLDAVTPWPTIVPPELRVIEPGDCVFASSMVWISQSAMRWSVCARGSFPGGCSRA